MELQHIHLAAFSPTGTTKRVVQAIADGLNVETTTDNDFTLPDDVQPFHIPRDHCVIFGAPVYAGRIPAIAVERLRSFEGHQTPAILVVVYGNRAFEDALLELRTIAIAQGFVPVAASAFIGEHSYATVEQPIAWERPDAVDLQKARDFGQHLKGLLDDAVTFNAIDVPGNIPYRDGGKPNGLVPNTLVELCTLCGICATVCPTGAITVSDAVVTDAGACIQCCACVKACPEEARVMDDPHTERIRTWLWEKCSTRREPELFLP